VALAPLTPDAYLNHLGRACDAFAACLETGDLDAPVPACPGWTLTDLAHHLGGVHRWARTAVVEGRSGQKTFDAPTDREALVGWFRDGATALVDTLRATDPDSALLDDRRRPARRRVLVPPPGARDGPARARRRDDRSAGSRTRPRRQSTRSSL
jgi:uncharacterized protein (TIGR03083 family)